MDVVEAEQILRLLEANLKTFEHHRELVRVQRQLMTSGLTVLIPRTFLPRALVLGRTVALVRNCYALFDQPVKPVPRCMLAARHNRMAEF